MAIVRPFKAIRPTRDKAGLVASRSYLSYSEETLKEKLENNPFTFLHIINPDYKKEKKLKGTNKFIAIREKFNEFKKKNIFITEKKKVFYIYQQKTKNHIYTGIIASTSVDDYINNKIKKHEKTLVKREKMFSKYLSTIGFNAEPVLLFHKKNNIVEHIINLYIEKRSEYEFATTNQAIHKLWIIDDEKDIKAIEKSFEEIDILYIADGHHRSASSTLLSKNNDFRNSQYFMSYLINENQLNIISFNRLIKLKNNLNKKTFLNKIESNFNIIKKNKKILEPKNKNEISMYFAKFWYLLTFKNKLIYSNCIENLDSVILSEHILKPILGIKNEKKDSNIVYEPGNTPLSIISEKVNSGEFDLAFILKPISIKELKEVADNNLIMPPKSTYIEPKLRSGLTIYSFND